MARSKQFDVEPDPVLCVLAKVLDATRDKAKLSDRDRYDFVPGEHRVQGNLDYDISFTVGEDAEAARYYGMPIDTVMLLAFHYAGVLRKHFARATASVKELRMAELECGEDGTPRPLKDVHYTFLDVDGDEPQELQFTIPAAQVQAEADLIALKLVGKDPLQDKKEQDRRAAFQAQIADCFGKLKVMRKYVGPINLGEVAMELHKQLAVAAEKVA